MAAYYMSANRLANASKIKSVLIRIFSAEESEKEEAAPPDKSIGRSS